jgi:hypothetical protein
LKPPPPVCPVWVVFSFQQTLTSAALLLNPCSTTTLLNMTLLRRRLGVLGVSSCEESEESSANANDPCEK